LIDQEDPKSIAKNSPAGALHPWRRFFARNLDLVFSMVPAVIIITLLLYLMLPNDQMVDRVLAHDTFLLIAAYLVWIPMEAGFLASIGTTPAKWIFGIRVQCQNGGNLTFINAFKRASLVFLIGDVFAVFPPTTILGRAIYYITIKKT